MLEIINEKYLNLLIEISYRPRNISELAKKGELTLSVASTIISRWARMGVLVKEKADHGRGNDLVVLLTPYGKEQVELFKKILKNHKKHKTKPDKEKTEKEVNNGETRSEDETDL